MKKAANLALGLAFVFGGLALLVVGLKRGLDDDPALVVSVFLGGLTVAGSIYGVGYQARIERRDVAAQHNREKISGYYEELIERLGAISERAEEGLTDDDLEFLKELARKMLLWTGPGMIAAWSGWLRLLEKEPAAELAMVGYGHTLKAIRAELGHDDSKLDLRDLLRLFVNDIDEHIPAGLK